MTDVTEAKGLTGKFTFKKGVKPTGLATVNCPYAWTNVKIAGKFVGTIQPPTALGKRTWSIGFVVASDGTSGWKWTYLKKTFETEAEARAFIIENTNLIQSKFVLTEIVGYEM